MGVLLHTSSHLSGLLFTWWWKLCADGGRADAGSVEVRTNGPWGGTTTKKWGDNKERCDDSRGRNKGREKGIKRGEIRRGGERGREDEGEWMAGMLEWRTIGKEANMAGLGLSDQKSAARRDHAHRNRLQNLY